MIRQGMEVSLWEFGENHKMKRIVGSCYFTVKRTLPVGGSLWKFFLKVYLHTINGNIVMMANHGWKDPMDGLL